jgi:hypothetical protein
MALARGYGAPNLRGRHRAEQERRVAVRQSLKKGTRNDI